MDPGILGFIIWAWIFQVLYFWSGYSITESSISRVEEFCFCSYDFCNGSSTKNSPPSHPSLLAFLSIIFHLRTLSHAPSGFSLLFTGLIFYISYSWSWLLVLVLVAGSGPGPGLTFHISYSCSWLNLPLASISRLAATLTNR